MSVPRTVIDGSVAYGVILNGTGIVTIGGTIYKVNNFKPNRAVTKAQQFNPDGTVGAWKGTAGFDTATGELQLGSNNINYPAFGQTFTCTCDSNYGSETWVIEPVSVEQSQAPGTIRVVPITCSKVYNSITTVP